MVTLLKKLITLALLMVSIPVLIWGAGFALFTGATYFMPEPTAKDSARAAIVLTGGTNRVTKGLDLLAQDKIDELLVSGVHKDVEIRDIMKLWGNTKNAPPCCITLGREAGNTIGNAEEARKWVKHIKAKNIYLITANYHMPRALLEFKHVMRDIRIIPYPVHPEKFTPEDDIFWRTSFVEYNKLLVTLFRVTLFPQEKTPLPDVLKPNKAFK